MDLGRTSSAAGAARHWLLAELDDLGVTDSVATAVRDQAALMLSELVANVVTHTRSNATATVEVTTESLTVAVSDDDPRVPVRRPPTALDCHGRGLVILDRLARGWGVCEHPVGKSVWFSVSIFPPSG